uniref:DNA-directed RNA polymerase n=1 Tax=viral metagenome TaxID=1070528 RepID=A0A6C0KEV1_9ZZZZ
MDNSTIWKIIDKYFTDNPQSLVRHHVESYNDFFKNGIFKLFKEKNPIAIQTNFDKTINDYRNKCFMYLGGKDGSKIYFGKPTIYDDKNSHYMFPNEARLRNMTYGMTIHYDVEIEFIDILGSTEQPKLMGIEDIEMFGGDSDSEDENANNRLLEIEQYGNGKLTEERLNEIKQKKREKAERELLEGGAKVKITKKKDVKLDELTPAQSEVIKEATAKSMVGNTQTYNTVLEKIYLGKFPIMVQSDFCVLSGLPKEVRHTMGECSNDMGGYFIIDGKEKTVITQEKFADNMLYIRDVNDEEVMYSAEIRSVSENVSKPIRTLSVKMLTPTKSYTNKNIVVNIPNIRKPVPLFIVFRALGIISDKEIITMCLLDLNKYDSMIDLFIPSVHDASIIMTQRTALQYLSLLTKGKTIASVLHILSDYFLPHIGETNFLNKAYYLGYIVFRLLCVQNGLEPPTDRDNFKYKRLELVGSLIHDLFREYYTKQQKHISLEFDKRINLKESIYGNNLQKLVKDFYKEIFNKRIVETGFRKAFKGNWGAETHTKRIGIVQDLNRLSFNSMMSHLRKTNLPLDSSVKLVGPRVLHSTQWGLFDPIDTPDGANIGIHKHLSISAYVSQGIPREQMIAWLREKISMKKIEDCSPMMLSRMTKIILNGLWAGSIGTDPVEAVRKIKLFRRNGLLPIYISATFNIKQQTIYIYTDSGRICRPIFYKDEETGKMWFENKTVLKKIMDNDFSWDELITGFNKKKLEDFKPNNYNIYELNELYEGIESEVNPEKLQRFMEKKAIIEYVDSNESEDALIAMNMEELVKNNRHTHLEIHESFIFGMMCNLINFPENNPATRNSFSCGQSKQACSVYHTNHQVRMDKTAVVLCSGQIPLIKSRYLEHINNEENPYGENAIVAIMCYTGYNVEDAILINEGALKRGLFRTTYYSTYEAHEEKTIEGDSVMSEQLFTNIEDEERVEKKKPGHDYSKLDKFGIIKENSFVDDKTILIGLSASDSTSKGLKRDMSITPKKGQLGVVDKTFITESEEGQRIAKVRVREERIPNIGDKMASRAGQKGTIGLVIPEEDMPFTKDGIRPDMIVNPHAIPSRMTIGHLVECIIGKACAFYGGFGDCTAFNNKGSKIGVFGEMLPKAGFHSSGNEILYNGMTGEQIETEIFIGPNYYMRLKHMVKDKINYRPLGPRTALTRQPVAGRANDGGLRIGEMERDSVISHGTADFLRESMMERGDKYYMAVCNKTGLIAIYNPAKHLFISPMADGPIKFTGSLTDKDMNINNVTKYGRDFSVVCIPYTLKLLIQELQTINVQMRIITEDNIQQLENLTYSNNVDKLLSTNHIEPQKIIDDIKIALRKEKPKFEMKLPSPDSSPASVKSPDSLPYAPKDDNSPPFAPNDDSSPPFAPGSPVKLLYEDDVFDDSGSPGFNPNSSPKYKFAEHEERMLDIFDNLDKPSTPSLSPPYSSETGTEVLESKFVKGEVVHFRGDFLPNRIWKIRNVGDRFITIETDNLEGMDDKDSIKVVTRMDIYRPGDFTYNEHVSLNNNITPAQPPQSKLTHGGFHEQTPAINFAPVFKIMNGGNDFSNGDPNATVVDSDIIPNVVQSGGEKLNTLTDLAVSAKPKIDIPVSSGGDVPQSKTIDFNNLVIKKV